jgi:translation initiation factor 4E
LLFYAVEILSFWLKLLAMIGEQFDEGDEICGAVVSVRRQDKIAIWTKTASNEAAQVQCGGHVCSCPCSCLF